nr:PREDICTED: uncharacterized protein LOC109035133 [Bemisia tabaci]
MIKWLLFLMILTSSLAFDWSENFVFQDFNKDTSDLYINYNGISAKQSITKSKIKGKSVSTMLRQLSDGSRFVQMVYGPDGLLQDCEYLKQKKVIKKFLSTFQDILESKTNITYLKSYQKLPSDINNWLSYKKLRHQCKKSHQKILKMSKQRFEKLPPTTTTTEPPPESEFERMKRGLQRLGIMPGTKWCGHRNVADSQRQLGGFTSTDRCCREHDGCQLTIPGLSTKFNVFNLSPFTLSFCGCDLKFRSCLKMADTGISSLVGQLFFNVVQKRCFVLKKEKVCVKRTWWGKCSRVEYVNQAIVRNNSVF